MDINFDFSIISKRSRCFIVFLGMAMVGLAGLQNSTEANEATDRPTILLNESLRGVYYGKGEGDPEKHTVGKLALELLEGDEKKTVRVDHPFRTGDRFRFKISSNQDGWLYILHRSTGEDLSLLWPRLATDNKDEYLDMNQIQANQTSTVPPTPGLFIFDGEVGDEHFYAVLADERKVPQFLTGGAAKSKVVESKDNNQSKRIVNFGLRGGSKTTALPLRGVIYDPGKEDADPFLYFGAPVGDDNQQVFVEFQLKHQE